MLLLAFVVAFFAAVSSQQAPCVSGQAGCADVSANSVQNETDCIRGYKKCSQIGVLSSVNGKYQCCKSGDRLTFSSRFVNGQRVNNYCVCQKNRPMTPEQDARLDATLQSTQQRVNGKRKHRFNRLHSAFGSNGFFKDFFNSAFSGDSGKK
ncbi:uncharacterized protein LOC106011865 [Aplysia californica]|uniref:Uncharacterized protein LOC106011865 n=1 Tax=Aplysia californica TaxID=6500 RepID=A0ABM1A0N5_APLCA|nr:uncharacterized protein LOC106011865 [Aplysia californica]